MMKKVNHSSATNKYKRAGRFAKSEQPLDFHDDNLDSVFLIAPKSSYEKSSIAIQFRDDETQKRKWALLDECSNLRWLMDFSVIAHNWFAQTKRLTIIRDPAVMRAFVTRQMPHWRVKYMPPMPSDKPIMKVLASIHKYTLYRFEFYGGTIECLARDLRILDKLPSSFPGVKSRIGKRAKTK